MLGVDDGKVVGKQPHSDPTATVLRMRSEQAQVVMRFLPWMCSVEAGHQVVEVVRRRTQVLGDEFTQPVLLLSRHLGAIRRNPDRRGFSLVGDPTVRVPEGALDEEAPEVDVVFGLPVGSCQSSAPQGIIGESQRDDARHLVNVGQGRPSSSHHWVSIMALLGVDIEQV